MRRFILATLATVLILPLSTTHAQIGGRIRSAVTNAARPQQAQGPAKMAPFPITAQTIANYEKALVARDQEFQRISRENTPIGQYYAAELRYQAAERRRDAYNAKTGPDYERAARLLGAMQQGDTLAPPLLAQLTNEVTNLPPRPELDWSTQQAANAHLDTVTMKAGGFDAGQWAYVGEKIPMVTQHLANSGVSDTVVERVAQTFGLTPAEVRAIGARRIELARGLGIPFKTDEQLANGGRETEPAADPTKDYNACMTQQLKPLMDEAERRKAEFEAAQRNGGDMSKLLDFTARLNDAQLAAMEKCAPLAGH